MILGVGTDLAEVDRIERTFERYGQRFLSRIYTGREIDYSLRKKNFAESLAARFAAKEAGMKAIGTGWHRGVTWRDFEVVNEASGRPTLWLSGVAATIAEQLEVTRISLSLTHTSTLAMAIVILEGDIEP